MRVRLLVILSLLGVATSAHADPLRVFAATNLQKILTQSLIPVYEKRYGTVILPTFGSTKLLATQIKLGAPADVFIAADTASVKRLSDQGLLDPNSVHPYAIGKLVLWTRFSAKKHPRSVQDLADPSYVRIAIANPSLAPYGVAAQQAFAAAGIASSVKPRIVQGENIGAALQYAQSGNADVAVTALSLVIDDKVDPYIVVPERLHSPIVQTLAQIKASSNPDARRFITFLTSKFATPIWKHYGYDVPPIR